MSSKLTLSIDDDVIRYAKQYANKHSVSLSKMVEQYLTLISDKDKLKKKLPPITTQLTGIASFSTTKTDKQLLIEALNKRYK